MWPLCLSSLGGVASWCVHSDKFTSQYLSVLSEGRGYGLGWHSLCACQVKVWSMFLFSPAQKVWVAGLNIINDVELL